MIDFFFFQIYIGSYDVITVVGSHTKNHIKGEALQEMIPLVKSGKWQPFIYYKKTTTTDTMLNDSYWTNSNSMILENNLKKNPSNLFKKK